MTQQRITVIRGDGIGPDIIDSAIQILTRLAVILFMTTQTLVLWP